MGNKRRINVKALTDAERDRLYEIQFYIFIKKLLDANNKSALTLDILDSLGNLFNCNIMTLKRLASDVYQDRGILVPSKQELAVMYYRSGVPILRIRELLQIHQQTLYRYLEDYISAGQFEYVYKTEDEDLVTIKRFMIQLEQLINWR
jgi:hypothetical protein